MSTDEAVVVDQAGRSEPLGDFLGRMVRTSGLSASEVARRAHLSRSFLYLLMDDKQVPSVESLVSLFEAVGAVGVRAAQPGERGEIALTWDDRRYWVRLPESGRRSARSKNALRTLSSNVPDDDEDFMAARARPDAVAFAPAPASSAPRRPRRGEQPPGSSRDDRDSRTQLLGELLQAAGNLDEERLRLLLEHANLLRRPY